MCTQNTFTITVWEYYAPLKGNQCLPPIPNRNEIDGRFPRTSSSEWIVEIKFFSDEIYHYKVVLYFEKEPPAYDTKWLTLWERFWYRLKK